MKNIMESWRKYLKEISEPEVAYFGKNFKLLFDDPNLVFDDEWVSKNIGPEIGSGAFRTTHAILGRDDLVFKRANKDFHVDGSYMNAEEKRLFNQYPKFFPKVYLTGQKYSSDEFAKRKEEINFGKLQRDISDLDSYVPWIIVEKVYTFSDENYKQWNRFIARKFKGIRDVFFLLKDEGIPMSLLRSNFDDGHMTRRVLGVFLTQEIKDDTGLLLVKSITRPRESVYPIPPGEKELGDKLMAIFKNSTEFDELRQFISDTGLGVYDIRPDNTGTDSKFKKLLFIDINK